MSLIPLIVVNVLFTGIFARCGYTERRVGSEWLGNAFYLAALVSAISAVLMIIESCSP